MVNKKHFQANDLLHNTQNLRETFRDREIFSILIFDLRINLIDLFRWLVYPEDDSMNCKMKRERFTDIYSK